MLALITTPSNAPVKASQPLPAMVEKLMLMKGQIVTITTCRDVKYRKDTQTAQTSKVSTFQCRMGVNYDNLKVVQEKREDGSLPAENAGLNGMEWVQFPHLLRGIKSGKFQMRCTSFNGNVLSITPAPLKVSANDANKIFNTADPLLSYLVAGLKLNDTVATTLNGELSRVTGETVGIYQINQGSLGLNTANFASSNYTMTYVPGSFTILLPTVIDEIVNTSLLLGTPDTGSAHSTSADDRKRKLADLVVTDTLTGSTQPLPVCN